MKKFKCPISGCPKRGTLGSLTEHARAKHPQIRARDYQLMVQGINSFESPDSPRWLAPLLIFGAAALILTIAIVIGINYVR